MRILYYVLIAIAFLLVTLFGLGPVLFADGSVYERMITLAVVLLLYVLLIWITVKIVNHRKNNK